MTLTRLTTLRERLRDFEQLHVLIEEVSSELKSLLDKENRRLKPVKEINVRRKRGLIHYWFRLGYEWSIYRYISTDSTRVDNWRRRDDISDRLLKIAKFLGKGKRFFRRSLR